MVWTKFDSCQCDHEIEQNTIYWDLGWVVMAHILGLGHESDWVLDMQMLHESSSVSWTGSNSVQCI